jgi:hypothetical protein
MTSATSISFWFFVQKMLIRLQFQLILVLVLVLAALTEGWMYSSKNARIFIPSKTTTMTTMTTKHTCSDIRQKYRYSPEQQHQQQHVNLSTHLSTSHPEQKIESSLDSRRTFIHQTKDVILSSVMLTSIATPWIVPSHVVASGGATAGGAYLLSAKQRYNDRVKKGVKSFVLLGSALSNGDVDTVKLFFDSEDEGSWKDFSAAGYLLSNAFRRNSTAPPDSLPSVKVCFSFCFFVC